MNPFFSLNDPVAKSYVTTSTATGLEELYKKYTKYLRSNLTDSVKK